MPSSRGIASLFIVIIVFSSFYYVYATPVNISTQTYQAVQGLYMWIWFENSAYPPGPGTPPPPPPPPPGGAPPPGPLPNMITSQSTVSGGPNNPYTLGAGQYEYLAPAAFSEQTSFSGGICTVVIYASGTNAIIKFALVILNSQYSVVQTITTSSAGPFTSKSATELVAHFTCPSFVIPAGDFLALQLSATGNPSIYWGKGYPTDLQVIQSADSA